MSEDLIGYDALTQEAMRQVVRQALTRALGPNGLPGRHHFYITFHTHAPGVTVPEHLSQRYADEMTIVLEHQFWDLEVHPDRFRVILKFQGQPYPLTVPFAALTRFYDPSVQFGLQFEHLGDTGEPPPAVAEPDPEAPQSSETGAVISLDAFRKK